MRHVDFTHIADHNPSAHGDSLSVIRVVVTPVPVTVLLPFAGVVEVALLVVLGLVLLVRTVFIVVPGVIVLVASVVVALVVLALPVFVVPLLGSGSGHHRNRCGKSGSQKK
jgi:hypothetical protein